MNVRNLSEHNTSKEVIGTVTSKGQVTIPVAVREFLGLEPQDKIVFRLSDDRVEVESLPMTLEEVYGSVTPIHRPEDFASLREIAREERVEKFADKLQ